MKLNGPAQSLVPDTRLKDARGLRPRFGYYRSMFLGQLSGKGRLAALAAAMFLAGLLAGGAVGPAGSAPDSFPARPGAGMQSDVQARPGYVTEIVRIIDGDTFEARVH